MFVLYVAVVVILFLAYVKWRQSYWKRKNLFELDHDFLLGNMRKILTGKLAYSEEFNNIYNIIKSKKQIHGGIYAMWDPLYIPIDPALIKTILVKDFSFLKGHGVYHHPKDILSMNLFGVDGDMWRRLRVKLSPTFTSGKMKMMFETLMEKTTGFETVVGKYADTEESAPIKEISGRFTTDIIGSCAFGIECNSLENPDNEFRSQGKKALQPGMLRLTLMSIIPWWLLGNLGFKGNGMEAEIFYSNIVKETIRYRETSNVHRNDFMQLLLQLKNESNIILDDDKENYTLTVDEIIAQCFVFFVAGFETSSTTMSFALLELSQNQDVQDRLRKENEEVLEQHGGNVTYNAVMSMEYLDKVVNETLRKFPPVPVIPRVCSKDYQIPGTDVVIEKGVRVQIPVWGLHKDPDYYPNPEVFNPENFSEENKAKRPDFTFLPFGEGPRMCIGMRFGLMQTKVGLISLVRKFNFTLNDKTKMPIEMERASVVLSAKGDIWLDVTRV
ncbi:probable cytochrome P450 6a21 isoform X1 [Sitophilus oryzae]|uniref:Probable cytochrome P450 6a21 isoform X1 n=1 Tax=Sitophilus oryzae TaxID=7048 RepID=A0A6J2X4C7_SITOR|nr:probable cytochrome P450 6a21 isoform X1 [Sitophilus oryzae]